MANARLLVPTPTSIPSKYGLLASLGDQLRSDPNSHWRNGTYIRSLCGNSNTTWDPCAVTGSTPQAPAKAAGPVIQYYASRPFTVFTEFQCSAPGAWDDLPDDTRRYIERSEQFAVERAFYTGAAAGVGGIVLPHLVSNTQTIEDLQIVQLAATSVTVTGGVAAKLALGRLEEALAQCYAGGVGYIHVSAQAFYYLTDVLAVQTDGNRLRTQKGNILVLADGYLDQAPNGTSSTNIAWMYATGAMYAYKSDVYVQPQPSTLDRTTNTVHAIAERTYTINYECCLLAAAVDLTQL